MTAGPQGWTVGSITNDGSIVFKADVGMIDLGAIDIHINPTTPRPRDANRGHG